ncbi:patatin-like phospholipase family protein [Teichococcus cervicalis]|uniref:PNPLA domain-containing protein n=1 Tax=Pseudoroseomonas cervicalis ATCC 49957 TaxID=525371 RepID=D5RLB9_9PROT|nr:patatin-like phospholipase family protein [Pseudoroseomonas cervicalis]EFH11906.1 hypothetical protein HMPREF0731_1880 [Pseudoroseomonas cervicalis ATCC 49957]
MTSPNPVAGNATFQLGLVLAGAVSAGAYTAGVLDFLTEALDRWDGAREAAVPPPAHRVVLKAVSSASAGSMCAAILAAAAGRRFPPVRATDHAAYEARQGGPRNPFYDSWVLAPRLERLLDTGDLQGGPLLSLLNGTWLRDVVDAALNGHGVAQGWWLRPWIDPALELRLTLGNLTGQPYCAAFGGAAGQGLPMMRHAAMADFRLGLAAPQGSWWGLSGEPTAVAADWSLLGRAALASGAFPLFLPARELPAGPANLLSLLVPTGQKRGPLHLAEYRTLAPLATPAAPATMLCVDGGVFDNEPVQLCRSRLVAPGERMPREGREADRGLIMVDPFPAPDPFGPTSEKTPIGKVAWALLSAWKNQARFRPEDIALAFDEAAYSRYLIAPSRPPGGAGGGAPSPLAAGGLAGFLGFFHVEYRRHDYFLGRRNAQNFLRHSFALPRENPLLADWRQREVAISAAYPELVAQAQAASATGGAHWPLVPLLGPLAVEEPLPAWPAGRFGPASLQAPLRARLKALLGASGLPRLLTGLGNWAYGDKAVDWAIRQVAEELRIQQL